MFLKLFTFILLSWIADFLNIVTEDYEPIHKQLDADFHNAIKMSVANQHNPLHLRAVLSSNFYFLFLFFLLCEKKVFFVIFAQ